MLRKAKVHVLPIWNSYGEGRESGFDGPTGAE